MSLMIKDLRKTPNNTNKNFNEKMEETTMNMNINNTTEMDEIKMASILEKLDKSGIKVGFTNAIPERLTNPENANYQIGFGTDKMPKINEPMVMGNNCYGLIIEGPGTKPSAEDMELLNYILRYPEESAPLVMFCRNCLLAGNVPVRKVDNYFICSNGKVLIRIGEDFESVYEGVALPNLQTMSDKECLDVIRSAIKTYTNLITRDRNEEEYEDEYEEEYEEEEDPEEEMENSMIQVAKELINKVPLQYRHIFEERFIPLIKNFQAQGNDIAVANIISDLTQELRHVNDLIAANANTKTKKEESKCGYDEDDQQNWIF